MYLLSSNEGLRFQSVLFEGNRAVNGNGGGVHLQLSNKDVLFEDCTFVQNSASMDGGGACCLNIENTVSLMNCNITGHKDFIYSSS